MKSDYLVSITCWKLARQHKRHLRTPYNLRDYISRLLRCGLFDHLNWSPSLKRFSHEHSFTLYTYTYIGTLINYTNLHYYIIKLVITFLKCLWFVKWIIVRHDMTEHYVYWLKFLHIVTSLTIFRNPVK